MSKDINEHGARPDKQGGIVQTALIAAEGSVAVEQAAYELRRDEVEKNALDDLLTKFNLEPGSYVLEVTMPKDKRSLGFDVSADIGPGELKAHDLFNWFYDEEPVWDLPSLGRAFTGKGYKLVEPTNDE